MKTPTDKPSSFPCPCHSGQTYADCCQPYHTGETRPGSPTALMRSRYSAYALSKTDYLMATTDPAGPLWQRDAGAWRREILQFCRMTTFCGLRLIETQSDTVTFEARLKQNGKRYPFVEHSRFTPTPEGSWRYWGPVSAGETSAETQVIETG
jgi:SEC-C motif domain protein